ncbi:hypothetical protein C2S51_023007 [Perilla frutescens var. frutescens]|nr:hypothetical protein C2S51_023007 [Perilla frutescens var. frutescens]
MAQSISSSLRLLCEGDDAEVGQNRRLDRLNAELGLPFVMACKHFVRMELLLLRLSRQEQFKYILKKLIASHFEATKDPYYGRVLFP